MKLGRMVTFIPNASFISDLEGEDETKEAAKEIAQQVADRANDLRHTIYREEGAVTVGEEGSTVYVVNNDPGGHLDEWGSKNNPAYAPLRRAVESMGLSFKPTSKG